MSRSATSSTSRDITAPMFVVGTETDHVAPWRSVYKVGKLVRSTDFTFCLTSGGHNAGIISGPQHPKRRHRVRTTKAGARLPSAETVPRDGRTAAGLVVADVGRVAGRALDADEGEAATDGGLAQGSGAGGRCAGYVRAAAVVPPRTPMTQQELARCHCQSSRLRNRSVAIASVTTRNTASFTACTPQVARSVRRAEGCRGSFRRNA